MTETKPSDAATGNGSRPVTRADLERKLSEIDSELQQTADAARPIAVVVAVGAAVAVVLIAFVIGRRHGRKKTTVVEVRRL
jgi:hypothetical protein